MNPVLEEVLRRYDKTATQRDELLEVTKHLLEWMRYVKLPAGEQAKNDFAADLDTARAAIAKAEGMAQ